MSFFFMGGQGFFSTDLPPPSVLAGAAVVPSTSAVVPNHGLERFVTQSLKVCPANICAECKCVPHTIWMGVTI
jgi:hypothetical protein